MTEPAGLPAARGDPRRQAWLDLVSGRRTGPAASLQRLGLSALAGAYRAGLAARNLFRGKAIRVGRPVISVGNLSVGGTGKTPMVATLARLVRDLGLVPVVVSRGYKAEAGTRSDEARELERLCPGVVHLEDPDRAAAIGRHLARKRPADVFLLDDGFQHQRLYRDLDIVLVDALRPLGFGHVLPRGLLREPPSALKRADVVVLTRTDLAGDAASDAVENEVRRWARGGVPVLRAAHQPKRLVRPDGSPESLYRLEDARIVAASGIGHPEAFHRTLEALGATVAAEARFPDHHAYTAAELAALASEAREAGCKMLVTTAKDFVKWRPLLAGAVTMGPVEVLALEVELTLAAGADALRTRVAALLAH